MTFVSSGDKYVGAFKNDKKHGQGTYSSSNGDTYVGAFENELFNGQGPIPMQMATNMLANSRIIKNMAMVLILGLMAKNT